MYVPPNSYFRTNSVLLSIQHCTDPRLYISIEKILFKNAELSELFGFILTKQINENTDFQRHAFASFRLSLSTEVHEQVTHIIFDHNYLQILLVSRVCVCADEKYIFDTKSVGK